LSQELTAHLHHIDLNPNRKNLPSTKISNPIKKIKQDKFNSINNNKKNITCYFINHINF